MKPPCIEAAQGDAACRRELDEFGGSRKAASKRVEMEQVHAPESACVRIVDPGSERRNPDPTGKTLFRMTTGSRWPESPATMRLPAIPESPMPLSMHVASVPVFQQMLTALAGVLAKAETFATERNSGLDAHE